MLRLIIKFISKIFGEERILYHFSGPFNRKLIEFKFYGYLHDIGWIESYKRKQSIDRQGNPIPWISYPLLDFLEPKLTRELVVFEYGGGNSTLYFRSRVKEIHTVESDLEWFNTIIKQKGENSFIYHEPISANNHYVTKPKYLSTKFDLIVIDGLLRKECILFCTEYLSDAGVILADDTNQNDYEDSLDNLIVLGFKRLDFWGLAPIISYKKASTLFYRPKNFLGL